MLKNPQKIDQFAQLVTEYWAADSVVWARSSGCNRAGRRRELRLPTKSCAVAYFSQPVLAVQEDFVAVEPTHED